MKESIKKKAKKAGRKHHDCSDCKHLNIETDDCKFDPICTVDHKFQCWEKR